MKGTITIPILLHILFTNLSYSAHHQAEVRSEALPSQGSKPGEETDVLPPSTVTCSRKVCVCGGDSPGRASKRR